MNTVNTIPSRSVVKAPQQNTPAKAATPFFSPVIQPKLTINQPNDPYEQEADAVADKVMRMTDHEVVQTKAAPVSIQTKCAHCEEEEKLQMKEEENEEEIIQKKCADCAEEEEQIQRKCEDCEEEEVHRKESGVGNTPAVSPAVHQTINSSGSPLDAGTRSFMESRFDCDFSEVQIHDDSLAHRSAKDINARAYTHGKHIAFGSGEYQPGTYQGKQLLAHELTHVVQQHNGSKSIQRRGLFVLPEDIPLKPLKLKNFLPPTTVIDIRGKTRLKLGSEYNGYLSNLFKGNVTKFLINVAFGDMGKGIIVVDLRTPGFSDTCVVDTMSIDPLPPMMEQCGDKFEAGLSSFDAAPQLIPVELPGLDTSDKSGTLALKVEIRDNVIVSNEIGAVDKNEAIAWVPGKTKSTLSAFDLGIADFSRQAFLPFIYGKDYDGTNFSGTPFVNHISDGLLIFNSFGILTLPNRQNIHGLIQLGDIRRWWSHFFDTDIVGAKDYEFPVTRTDKGELSGEGDGLLFDETWTLKGFNAKGSLRISFINSNLQVEGKASYGFNTKRARGELEVVVTDYATAKRFATDFLPDEIANKSRTDPPPNPSERLAFAGAGNISFTLFDGNKENRKKLPDPKSVIGDPPAPQPNVPLAAEASFVVEPEGYITIAGQVEIQKQFDLFPESKPRYQKDHEKNFTIFSIPGPAGTSVNIDFGIKLAYGATIGPATLSEIKAEGIYSSRPDTASELELSAFAKIEGGLFVELSACIKVTGSFAKIFDITLIEWCPLVINLGAKAIAQARPTIQVVNPKKDPDRNTPPEYYIRGAFNFDAGAKLVLSIGDSLTINLGKKEFDDDPKKKEKYKSVPKDYKYKRNHKTIENKYGSKDLEIPMDHTLGSEEIPRVSFTDFLKDNLEERVRTLITQDRPRKRENEEKYFEPGQGDLADSTPDLKQELEKPGEYEEQGEERSVTDDAIKPKPSEEPSYVFEEEFTMDGAPHKLTLIIYQQIVSGIANFKSVLMMESELEEVSDKIEEEKQELKNNTDPVSEFKKKDLANIEAKADQIKKDADAIGVSDKLSNTPRNPALRGLAVSTHNYGDRYKKKDFGTPDVVNKPACPEPVDAETGMEITFTKYKGHKDKGRVTGVAAYTFEGPKGKTTQWTIKYKPYGSRSKTVVSAPAYDENCQPLYIITKTENCEGVITDKLIRYTLARTVNSVNIPERKKANWVKAYPLCWGPYQDPIDPVVGVDRIHSSEQSKWHRAHLIHGNMGGPGLYWNLIPVPKHINNEYLPDQYEKDLKDKVRNGIKTGTAQYWFEAKVHYQEEYHPVIGHYNDYVKALDVEYGELDKDPDDGSWIFLPGTTKSLYFGKVPLKDDLEANRVRG